MTWNRRSVIGTLLATIPACAVARRPPIDRIGVTSVCFRSDFEATRGHNDPNNSPPSGRTLDLERFPGFVRRELGLTHVEFWSRHVAVRNAAYARRLRSAVADAGCQLVNIQLDGEAGVPQTIDLAAEDPAARSRWIDETRRWMDFARECGTHSLRPNTGLNKPGRNFDV
ncbi:MAG TPA: hypothetical protein VNT42_05345, partial [Sphingomonas sp.]|nr:hypothetical protein [Sphingomonas sp.]